MKHSKKIVKDAALGEEPKVDSLRERVYQYLKDAMSAGKLRYGEFLDQAQHLRDRSKSAKPPCVTPSSVSKRKAS